MRKYNNAKQMDEAQMGTHPAPEFDLMVEDSPASEGDAFAAVAEEAELLHASVKVGSVAQIVVAFIAVIGLNLSAQTGAGHDIGCGADGFCP